MAQDTNYPEIHRHFLSLMGQYQRENRSVMEGFGALHKAVVADGALDPKTTDLVAHGTAISVRCEGCISFYVHDAVKAGASRPEVVETIGVAVLMRGGPSLMYGLEAFEALGQFEDALG